MYLLFEREEYSSFIVYRIGYYIVVQLGYLWLRRWLGFISMLWPRDVRLSVKNTTMQTRNRRRGTKSERSGAQEVWPTHWVLFVIQGGSPNVASELNVLLYFQK